MPNQSKNKKLKNLAEIHYGKSPKAILTDDGQIPVIGTGGVERFGKDYLFDGESIVLGRKGTIDNPVYVNGKFWAIDTTFYLRDFKETDVKWLYYFLRTINFRSMSEATGVPSLSRDFLYSIEVNSPSKSEQTQIAAVLSCIDRAIEHTEALIAKQQRIKTGLMQDLLTKGIDERGNIRSEATHEFKDSPLGRIPKEWRISQLGDEFTLQRGFDITQDQQRPGQFPVVSSSGITSYHDEFSVVGPGVVIGRKGKLGNAYYLECPFWAHDTTLWVKDFHGNSPKFAAYFLESLKLERFDAATSVPTLNRNFVHPLIVAIPSYGEQLSISTAIEDIGFSFAAEKKFYEKLRVLKQGLMQDLLTGKVSVSGLLAESMEASAVR